MSYGTFFWIFVIVAGIIGVWGTGRIFKGLRHISHLHQRLDGLKTQAQTQNLFSKIEKRIRLDRDCWAEFERSLPNLKQVVVVADKVEEPYDSLRKAVIHNFSRGVRYSFIVSRSKAGDELHGWFETFKGFAMAAIQEHKLPLNVEQLLTIQALPDYDWNGMPFIFYRIENTDVPITARTRFRTLAFWGDTAKAGIAKVYESLPSPIADALATALMSGAPKPIKHSLSNFEQDNFQEVRPYVVSKKANDTTSGHRQN